MEKITGKERTYSVRGIDLLGREVRALVMIKETPLSIQEVIMFFGFERTNYLIDNQIIVELGISNTRGCMVYGIKEFLSMVTELTYSAIQEDIRRIVEGD